VWPSRVLRHCHVCVSHTLRGAAPTQRQRLRGAAEGEKRRGQEREERDGHHHCLHHHSNIIAIIITAVDTAAAAENGRVTVWITDLIAQAEQQCL